MTNAQLLLRNCKRYDSGELVDIAVVGGKISRIGRIDDPQNFDRIVDAGGKIVAPGFIDVHIQGAGGADVLDGTPEALQTMSQTLARLGVTGFLATTVMKPETKNHHLSILAENWQSDLGGAHILGLHLEGPFINPVKKGGISPTAIYASSPAAFREVLEITQDSLKMMTIAPELDGNLAIIGQLCARDVVPAFAHSNASYEQAQKGFEAGIRHVTHIFNAMPPLHHREPGPLMAILESDSITVQIISDGVHLHPRIVNFLYRNLGPRRCVCITDGIQAMGLPEGRFIYNGRAYESKDGAARYDDGTLIGSAISVAEAACRFRRFTNCSLKEAIETVTLNPARVLGIDHCKGSLEAGKDADLVVMDEEFGVSRTIIGGKIVHEI